MTRSLLVVLTLLLLPSCNPVPQTRSTFHTTGLTIDHVRLTVTNNTGSDLLEVVLRYDDEERTIPALPAGASSEPLILPFAYQSPDHLEARDLDGTVLAYSNLDGREMTGESPITGGEYELILEMYEDELIAQEVRPKLDPVRAVLQPLLVNADATHEQRVQRGTPFDELAGKVVSRQEGLLLAPGERADAFLFADEATAQRFAETIQAGGTMLRDESQAEAEPVFLDVSPGSDVFWWQAGAMLLVYHGSNPDQILFLSERIDSKPLPLRSDVGDLQLRLYNAGSIPFDAVAVESGAGSANFGPLPPGQMSEYQPVEQLYRYGAIQVAAPVETLDVASTGYAGETPLPSGRYTYALQLSAHGGPIQMMLPDDEPLFVDEGLLDRVWEWQNAHFIADQAEFTPTGAEGPPTLRFTTDVNPNPGEEGFFMGAYLGCNGGGGTYLVNQYQQLLLIGGARTDMGCESELVMETEQRLSEALHGVINYEVTENTLTLNTHVGVLRFAVREASNDPTTDIYRTLLAEWNSDDVALIEQNVFANEDETTSTVRERYDASGFGRTTDVEGTLWEALHDANATLEPPPVPDGILSLSSDKIEPLVADPVAWSPFQNEYPNIERLFTCSRAGINDEEALLYCLLRTEDGTQSLLAHFIFSGGRWWGDWSTTLGE